MKKIYTLVITLAAFITQAQTNFENISLSTYFDGSDLSGTDDGSGNYTSEYMEGDLSFSTTWNNSWSYWSGGWAFSNLIDSTLEVASQTYHSFSTGVYSGDNFAIGKSGSEIIVNGVANFSTIQVCNTSYAAHSMTNGDSFGKQFTGEDWFSVGEVLSEGGKSKPSKGPATQDEFPFVDTPATPPAATKTVTVAPPAGTEGAEGGEGDESKAAESADGKSEAPKEESQDSKE